MLRRVILVGLGALTLAGCSLAGLGGAAGLFTIWAGALALLLVAALAPLRSARAGAPVQCQGQKSRYCDGNYIQQRCCPTGAKCNFRTPRFTQCGDGYCVLGGDRGRCPAPQAQKLAVCDRQSCGNDWEKACIDRKLTHIRVVPVPTNYTGPSRNPSFRTCGGDRVGDRCTTHTLLEDCFAAKGEIRDSACQGQWVKVCLGGKVGERCLPAGPTRGFPAATFAACPDGTCAVGDATACPP